MVKKSDVRSRKFVRSLWLVRSPEQWSVYWLGIDLSAPSTPAESAEQRSAPWSFRFGMRSRLCQYHYSGDPSERFLDRGAAALLEKRMARARNILKGRLEEEPSQSKRSSVLLDVLSVAARDPDAGTAINTYDSDWSVHARRIPENEVEPFFARLARGLGERAWLLETTDWVPFRIHLMIRLALLSSDRLTTVLRKGVELDVTGCTNGLTSGFADVNDLVFVVLHQSGSVRSIGATMRLSEGRLMLRLSTLLSLVDPDLPFESVPPRGLNALVEVLPLKPRMS